MPTVLLAYGMVIDSDRAGPVTGANRPDHALVFWNEHCARQLVDALERAAAQVVQVASQDASSQEVEDAITASGSVDILVVFGHCSPPPPTPLIWNRRKNPRGELFDKETMRAASMAIQVLLGCHSLIHFQTAAGESGVLAVVGFWDRAYTPAVLSNPFLAEFDGDQQKQVIGLYRTLFVDLAVFLVGSLFASPGSSRGTTGQCSQLIKVMKQQVRQAAGQCGRLYRQTGNLRFFEHRQYLLRNADSLGCLPS